MENWAWLVFFPMVHHIIYNIIISCIIHDDDENNHNNNNNNNELAVYDAKGDTTVRGEFTVAAYTRARGSNIYLFTSVKEDNNI